MGSTVRGNRELIGQAIANLVDNALKYGAPHRGAATPRRSPTSSSPRGGPANPSCSRSPTGVRESRRRTGRGCSTGSSGSKARVRGRVPGLGLSLAAAVARMHGGTVELEDNQPGLRVRLTLPAADEPASIAGPRRTGLE